MSDGEAEPGKRALVTRFAEAFGLSDAEMEPRLCGLVARNGRAVLDR